jgi:hypothetical protein
MDFLSFLIVIACLLAIRIEGKINDKLFLSKCKCTDFGKADCEFEGLSKKNLLSLAEKLVKYRIVCVKSDEYFLPTFSASLFSASSLSAGASASSSSSGMSFRSSFVVFLDLSLSVFATFSPAS